MHDSARPRLPTLLGLWLTLLLVLGLVAMHDLGGGTSHVMQMPGGALAAAPAVHHAVDALPTPHLGSRTPAAELASELRDAPSHAMTMCLAILLGALVWQARARLPGQVVTPAGPGPLVRPRSLPLGRGPPRSLLARLCILRT